MDPSSELKQSHEQRAGGLRAESVRYLRAGWSIVPLHGKAPAIQRWKEYQTRLATFDEASVWFTSLSRMPSGVGIVTGSLSGLVVVDCDSSDDARYWSQRHPASPMVVATGGGGVHYYYAMPGDAEVRNRAGVLGRKIDVRGEGGYAAAPPSVHPSGARYSWLHYDLRAKLPVFDAAWLVDASRPKERLSKAYAGVVRNAVAYIRKIHAEAGQGGHNATFRAACRLRDAGLSEDEALAILSDWNETHASPPWSARELEHKIHSAFEMLIR